MIDLYAAPTLNGMRAKIMLDECALPYCLHRIDSVKGDTQRPEFLAISPLGHVPVIVDHGGPDAAPITLTHSVSILIYLADKAKKFIPADPRQRLHALDALMNIAIDLGQTLDSMIILAREGGLASQCRSPFELRFRSYLAVWNQTLQQNRFCAGDAITIADFAMISIAFRGRELVPTLMSGLPSLARWEKEMAARPGIQLGRNFN